MSPSVIITIAITYVGTVVLYVPYNVRRSRPCRYDLDDTECKVRAVWMSLVWPLDVLTDLLVWVIRLPRRYL